MKKALLLLLVSTSTLFAQKEKIKGNKIVTTKQHNIESFHTIEIGENFDIFLTDDTINQVAIETDENLQDIFNIKVTDSVLRIVSTKKIKSKKELKITVSHVPIIKKIVLHDKVHLKSLTTIRVPNLRIESNGSAEADLTVATEQLEYIGNEKSTTTLHAESASIAYQLNESAKLKGSATGDNLKIDLYKKADAKVEGTINTIVLRAHDATNFYGHKLATNEAEILAEGSSDCYLMVNKEIKLKIKDKSEFYFLGKGKIHLDQFTDEAILYKKDAKYTPSIF